MRECATSAHFPNPMEKHTRLLLATVSVFAGTASLSAATVLNPGATFNTSAANWSNGAPGAGNDGTINADYTFVGNSAVGSGTYSVTQTAGNGTGGGQQWNYYNNSGFTFNLQGGSITATAGDGFYINAGTFNLSGGLISATPTFKLVNGGRLNISGGTAITLSNSTLFFGSGTSTALTLTGGTINAASATSLLTTGSLLTLIGDSATINASNLTAFSSGGFTTSTLNFLSGWTGSLNLSSSTDWSAQLINSGATLHGVDIDGSNIGQFNISGGTISAVPEPSTYGLLGAGALAAVAFVRRRRKAGM